MSKNQVQLRYFARLSTPDWECNLPKSANQINYQQTRSLSLKTLTGIKNNLLFPVTNGESEIIKKQDLYNKNINTNKLNREIGVNVKHFNKNEMITWLK